MSTSQHKKVLVYTNGLNAGGAETAFVTLLRMLSPREYEVDLILYDNARSSHVRNLTDMVPDWVRTHDYLAAGAAETKNRNALGYARGVIRDKQYDYAVSFGEWVPSYFVAYEVQAHAKGIWLHTSSFEDDAFAALLAYNAFYDHFWFVSENARNRAVGHYPYMKQKAVVVHNVIDVHAVVQSAQQPIDDLPGDGTPLIVTVANIRPEKNHKRALEAAALLLKRGVAFRWAMIGNISDPQLFSQLQQHTRALGLQEHILWLGGRDNPHPYVKRAAVAANTSDHESWSLVITEARALQVPVVATRTAGAQEQLQHAEDGYLTDFTAEALADGLYSALSVSRTRTGDIPVHITRDAVCEFTTIIHASGSGKRESPDASPRRVLMTLDNINYMGGAHQAVRNLLAQLKDHRITILTGQAPQKAAVNAWWDIPLLVQQDCNMQSGYTDLIQTSLLLVLRSPQYTIKQKLQRVGATIISRLGLVPMLHKKILKHLSDVFAQYDIVCVVGENSIYRRLAGESLCKTKIAWIHTDYMLWRQNSRYARQISARDKIIYQPYDTILFISEQSRQGFIKRFPQYRDKAKTVANPMPTEHIRSRAQLALPEAAQTALASFIKPDILHMLTVARLDNPKGLPRMLRVASKLAQQGFAFQWVIVGDGPQHKMLQSQINHEGLQDRVILMGAQENPYPFYPMADVFALLSEYEGLPNTICESLILHTPVLATDVGGISGLVRPGHTGWLTENDEDAIFQSIKQLFENPDQIIRIKQALQHYEYDNQAILDTWLQLIDHQPNFGA